MKKDNLYSKGYELIEAPITIEDGVKYFMVYLKLLEYINPEDIKIKVNKNLKISIKEVTFIVKLKFPVINKRVLARIENDTLIVEIKKLKFKPFEVKID